MKGTDMKRILWFLGVTLIIVGRVAVWAGETLFHAGVALKGDKPTKAHQRVSQSPTAVLVPYTVRTDDGHLVTLYEIRR
jgi:hypothetical protein